jgi:hypothetical protein
VLDNIINAYPEEDFLIADGFDAAIIGIDTKTMRIIYSVNECIDILINHHDMPEEDAYEYFEFNVVDAYVGKKTPIWCYQFAGIIVNK